MYPPVQYSSVSVRLKDASGSWFGCTLALPLHLHNRRPGGNGGEMQGELIQYIVRHNT